MNFQYGNAPGNQPGLGQYGGYSKQPFPSQAYLGRANLGRANLGQADPGQANLGQVNLGQVNLGQADPGPTVITMQQQVPQLCHVSNYMEYSIFTMLCCCPPLGLVALIFSIFARDAKIRGEYLTAAQSSKTAKIFNHVAVGLGIGSVTFIVIFLLIFLI